MSNHFTLSERDQRIRTLSAITWTVLNTSVSLGLLKTWSGTWGMVIPLLSLALICVPLLWLNSKGQSTPAALILGGVVLLVITLSLINGDGIRDPGILAYPIFIMMGILFFGRRAAPYLSLAAIASLVGIVYLEIQGYIHPTVDRTRFDDLLPMLVLILAATALIWVAGGAMEVNLGRVEKSGTALRADYDLTLAAWAKVLEYRDREKEGHSQRLVDLSTQLAQAMGLNQDEIAHLERGALLHDIGKLAIPDEILLKPGTLNDAERKLLQQHPVFAKQMLSHISSLQPALDVAYSHHERWDGLGYPEGLKGAAIPLSARIFAVVEQWDVLTSDRPYRKAWTRDAVIAHLQENAGKIYDPEIINVFLTII